MVHYVGVPPNFYEKQTVTWTSPSPHGLTHLIGGPTPPYHVVLLVVFCRRDGCAFPVQADGHHYFLQIRNSNSAAATTSNANICNFEFIFDKVMSMNPTSLSSKMVFASTGSLMRAISCPPCGFLLFQLSCCFTSDGFI